MIYPIIKKEDTPRVSFSLLNNGVIEAFVSSSDVVNSYDAMLTFVHEFNRKDKDLIIKYTHLKVHFNNQVLYYTCKCDETGRIRHTEIINSK